jgi:hypothetical protein
VPSVPCAAIASRFRRVSVSRPLHDSIHSTKYWTILAAFINTTAAASEAKMTATLTARFANDWPLRRFAHYRRLSLDISIRFF